VADVFKVLAFLTLVGGTIAAIGVLEAGRSDIGAGDLTGAEATAWFATVLASTVVSTALLAFLGYVLDILVGINSLERWSGTTRAVVTRDRNLRRSTSRMAGPATGVGVDESMIDGEPGRRESDDENEDRWTPHRVQSDSPPAKATAIVLRLPVASGATCGCIGTRAPC
jgi:hypothetical protein